MRPHSSRLGCALCALTLLASGCYTVAGGTLPPITPSAPANPPEESEETWVEGLLIFALPFAQRGHEETVERMADHLYAQLHDQRALDPLSEAPVQPR